MVQFRQVQQQDFQEESVEFGTGTLLLSGLVISQTYEVQVLAVNGKGRGPPSTPATIYVGEAGEEPERVSFSVPCTVSVGRGITLPWVFLV